MAKGFTVKAAAPKVSETDWDYDAIKEIRKPSELDKLEHT